MFILNKHQKIIARILHIFRRAAVWTAAWCLALILTLLGYAVAFEIRYRNRIFPNVTIDNTPFAGQTIESVREYWQARNEPFKNAVFEFQTDTYVATLSGQELELGYDPVRLAHEAFNIGRSGYLISDFRTKYFSGKIDVMPLFHWNIENFTTMLDTLATATDVAPQEALFTFSQGKVTAFKPSLPGRRLNRETAANIFSKLLLEVPSQNKSLYRITFPVESVNPAITTDRANSFGIKELIGTGYSEFSGSIAGRIHNVALAASRFNGVLIPPGETLSFNKTLGDVSAATGYQPAYIIKSGRTVLGDGGGVCQVSSTLFRAALNAGLPIPERHAHAYRVHYYEEGGFKPGLDATVFDPSVDLKIVNDTPSYILIQTKTDTRNLSMVFDLYGLSDGRTAEITNHQVWDVAPPPPALYQDDPTLSKDETKQVDFAAWGAKASFQYRVIRDGQTLQDKKFLSVYRPWQAVFLKGTKE